MSRPALGELAAQQYAKVRQRFGFADFRRALLELIEPPVQPMAVPPGLSRPSLED